MGAVDKSVDRDDLGLLNYSVDRDDLGSFISVDKSRLLFLNILVQLVHGLIHGSSLIHIIHGLKAPAYSIKQYPRKWTVKFMD